MHRIDFAKKPVGYVNLADCWYPCIVKNSLKSKKLSVLFLNQNGEIGGGSSCTQEEFCLELPPGIMPSIPMPSLFPAPLNAYSWVSIVKPDENCSCHRVRIGGGPLFEEPYLHRLAQLLELAAKEIERMASEAAKA